MERCSHALVSDGSVWLVDPVDHAGLDDEVVAQGRPAGVIQLLDRHNRDGAAIAGRLGIPHLVNPATLPGTPFEPVRVPATPGWRETALWWPEQKTLVVAEALGTAQYYCARNRPLGVHPVLRLWRRPKVLLPFAVELLLVGHGPPLSAAVEPALQRAVSHAGRELPSVLLGWLRRGR